MVESGVEFADVNYTLPQIGGGSPRQILRNVSLKVEAGTTTALLGRSGSGKTTLLRMVNGLVIPTSGKILIHGAPVSNSEEIHLRRSMGYVIQESGLFPHMSVERNAGLALELAGEPKQDISHRAAEVLELAGLNFGEFRERYPWQLSGGQRQRVGLARALATDPAILLMDEPFGALDPMTRAAMQTMLSDLLQRVKKTVLLVTHDLDEALYLAHRVIFLEQGNVVADVLANEVPSSTNAHVKHYVSAVHRTVLG